MPVPVVTMRALRNQSSGLDLNIASVNQKVGLLTTIVEYSIVVVSNLQYFKLPQHKETDVIQFAIVRTYEDFEKLRQGLITVFPGTMLPQLPKSPISSLFETNAAAKRTAVDELVRVISSKPHIAKCHVTLEFLGVNPMTAGKFTAGKTSSQSSEGEVQQASSASSAKMTAGLFDDSTIDSDDLFATAAEAEPADGEIFNWASDPVENKAKDQPVSYETRLYDNPNLDAEGISNEEEDLFLVPGARIDQHFVLDTDDISDLLTVEDNLEMLLQQPTTSKTPRQQSSSTGSNIHATATSSPSTGISTSSTALSDKPVPRPKPQLPSKATTASSPKPSLPPKPVTTVSRSLPAKSATTAKSTTVTAAADAQSELINTEKLNITDIAKYIQENMQSADIDDDLFG